MTALKSEIEDLVTKRLCLAAQSGVLIANLWQRAIDVKRPRGAPTGNAWCLAQDHFDPEILYAGLGSGIFRSLDAGSSWVSWTPKRAQGEEIWSLAASPWKSQTVYAGTSGPRLFKCADPSQKWEEIEGVRDVPGAEHWSFPEPPHTAHIRSMPFDAKAKEVLYLGVEEGGIPRTRNEKIASERRPLRRHPHPRSKPRRARSSLCNDRSRFYLSENGGLSWEFIKTGNRPPRGPFSGSP